MTICTIDNDNNIWIDIVTEKKRYNFKFVAAKILCCRLIRAVREDPTPENIIECANNLQAIFANNTQISSVREDIQQLTGKSNTI